MGRAYRGFLFALATIPAVGLFAKFVTMQKVYAIVGALFIPLLAVALLILNGRSGPVAAEHRNRWGSRLVLGVALLFFLGAGLLELKRKLL